MTYSKKSVIFKYTEGYKTKTFRKKSNYLTLTSYGWLNRGGRFDIETNATKGYKGENVVESHDHPRPERTRYVEKE